MRIRFVIAASHTVLMVVILKRKRNDNCSIETMLCLALSPTIYFFNHLVYTDAASLASILAVFALAERDNHLFAAIVRKDSH